MSNLISGKEVLIALSNGEEMKSFIFWGVVYVCAFFLGVYFK